MAVIEDLPPELLHRIIQLSMINPSSTFARKAARAGLTEMSLVARSWRAPSQSLLTTTFETHTAAQVWSRCLQELELGQAGGARLGCMLRLELPGSDLDDTETSATEQLDVLAEYGIAVQELYVLTLKVPIEVEGDTENVGSSMMDSLSLGSRLAELPSFFLPLSSFAPRLDRLELTFVMDQFADRFDGALQEIAPHLKSLHLWFKCTLLNKHAAAGDIAHVLSLRSFLSACTSLTALSLKAVAASITDLRQLLSSISAPLKHFTLDIEGLVDVEGTALANALATAWASYEPTAQHYITLLRGYGDAIGIDQRGLPLIPLASLLEPLCMRSLKRWRLIGPTPGYEKEWRSMQAGQREVWEAACRARGVEPRGEERYFTD